MKAFMQYGQMILPAVSQLLDRRPEGSERLAQLTDSRMRRVPRLALVVFVNRADSLWLLGLRPGFRHCFVLLRDERTWLACDSLKDRLELSILPIPPEFNLAGFYARQGHTVLLGATRPNLPRRPLTVAPLTCVTIAKRLLGVRAPLVVTPWQLCRHLKSDAHGFASVAAPTESTLDKERK